ncbi:MAG TPA: branched-chain amino acid ABC transporter substrate-binding protein [Thermoleophilia bacterium]|nr:branched-chain amino acid ABC transporter substrate-binding protein [Thermoleophilia bacterium]
MKPSLLARIGVLLVGIATGACTSAPSNVLKIGAAGPMTGDQSKMGMDLRHGVELAVDEWNARGGVLGKRIVVQVEDDQHDPKQAVAVANKLVHSGVVGVIGHWNSSASIPASGVYSQAKVVMITPASTNPRLTEQGFPTVFRICGRDDQQGPLAARFVREKFPTGAVAVLHDKTTYGQGLAEEFQKALGGGPRVVFGSGITQGDKDFRAVLTTVKAARPDIIFFGGIYPEAALLVRQARELGLTAPFISGDGTYDQKFLEIAGPAADGTYLTFGPDPADFPQSLAFLTKYHERFGPHGPYSIYAYDAANILLSAIAQAGTTDGLKLAEVIRGAPHQGAQGEIRFDAKGDVLNAPYIVWIVKQGRFEKQWVPGAS